MVSDGTRRIWLDGGTWEADGITADMLPTANPLPRAAGGVCTGGRDLSGDASRSSGETGSGSGICGAIVTLGRGVAE